MLMLTSASAPPPAVADALIVGDTLPAKLSDFHLLGGAFGRVPNARVTPYDLNTPLFSDYAEKFRFIYVPEGKTATVGEHGLLDFPVGTALIKSFGYPADMRAPDRDIRILETRLLLRRASGWVALPYVWNADGSEAVLKRAGTRIAVSWTHTDGKPRTISYAVPNSNQCKGCHELAGAITPIGPKTRNLHRDDQLERLMKAGVMEYITADFEQLPRWDDAKGRLEPRARAYLDVNCGHCHNRKGPASTSGLFLTWEEPVGVNYGIGKRPTAAGRGSGDRDFAIEPSRPERSIMLYRMASTDPGIAMPELGRATAHDEGIALLSEWIAAMPRL